jgi:hypothetical protein
MFKIIAYFIGDFSGIKDSCRDNNELKYAPTRHMEWTRFKWCVSHIPTSAYQCFKCLYISSFYIRKPDEETYVCWLLITATISML